MLFANLVLLESLLPIGSGLEVWGEFKLKSLRIKVAEVRQVDLPQKSKWALAKRKR